jgi:hypothetical protein
MAKPDADEIHEVLELARELAGDEEDQGKLARCLLYFHDRNLHLEQVYQDVEHYLLSGLAEFEHARLLGTLERAREADLRWVRDDQDEILGLE